MDTERFEGCCGAYILYDFGEDAPKDEIPTITDIRQELKVIPRGRLVLAITNPDQLVVTTRLTKIGFDVARTWLNKNTGRKLTLLSYYKP